MTVKELIEWLEEAPSDSQVVVEDTATGEASPIIQIGNLAEGVWVGDDDLSDGTEVILWITESPLVAPE